jgi:hypothetical protein
MTPVRQVSWQEDQTGRITLIRERPSVRGVRSLGRWVSFMMAPPRIKLDEVGSYAWLRMSGAADVRTLVSLVRSEFGESVEPVNERLGQFVRLLHRERFITYAEPSEDPTTPR